LPGQITVKDDTLNTIIIPGLDPLEAQQTLGVCLAPDGNDRDKATYLRNVTTKWKLQMAKAKVNYRTAEFCFCQVLLPKLMYTLIVTNFSKQQCQDILKPAINQALLAMGINHHFP